VATRGLARWRLPILAALYLVIFLAFDLAYSRWVLPPATTSASRPHAIEHPVHHHDLAPLVVDSPDRWGRLDFRVTTNSLGFRDSEPREISLRSDRRRILLLGDSFTFGVGYGYRRTFAYRFSEWMRERDVEVLNAAVVSYSPVIHVRKLEHLLVDVGLTVDEVIVFLDVSDTKNDALDYQVDEEGGVVFAEDRRITRVLARHLPLSSGVVAWIGNAVGATRTDAEGWSTRGSAAGMWTLDDALYEAWGRRGQETMARNMDALRGLVAQRGIDLSVVVYPWPDQILHGDLDSRQVRFWRAWCGDRGVRFLNFFPDFIGASEAANHAVVERYFIPDDIHYNVAGNAYFAERLIERFERPDE
jgi:lysophospholipase L1-like esterase